MVSRVALFTALTLGPVLGEISILLSTRTNVHWIDIG